MMSVQGSSLNIYHSVKVFVAIAIYTIMFNLPEFWRKKDEQLKQVQWGNKRRKPQTQLGVVSIQCR